MRNANNANNTQIKPPSVGKTIAKIAFGAIFVVSGFTAFDKGLGTVVTCIIMGAALIAWGVLGYKTSQKAWDDYQASLKAQTEDRVRFCRHCGARTKGKVCEYCGCPLD